MAYEGRIDFVDFLEQIQVRNTYRACKLTNKQFKKMFFYCTYVKNFLGLRLLLPGKAKIADYGLTQGQLQEWTEHSHWFFENLKP